MQNTKSLPSRVHQRGLHLCSHGNENSIVGMAQSAPQVFMRWRRNELKVCTHPSETFRNAAVLREPVLTYRERGGQNPLSIILVILAEIPELMLHNNQHLQPYHLENPTLCLQQRTGYRYGMCYFISASVRQILYQPNKVPTRHTGLPLSTSAYLQNSK